MKKKGYIMLLTLKLETQLITWNEVAKMCWSKDSNHYARTKKREQMFLKHEIRKQVPIKNYFGENSTLVTYEWHTSTKLDLGNLTAGEKFIADAFNELGLWSDDRYISEIRHKRVTDDKNFVIVTIKGAKKR